MLAVAAKPLRATLVARFTAKHGIDGTSGIMGQLITKLVFKLVMMNTQ